MAKYKVALKQGQKTWIEYVEADSVDDILGFYSLVSTAKVIRIEKIVYEASPDVSISVDDRKYWSLVKVIARRDMYSRQYIFHNLKLSMDSLKLAEYMRKYLKVAGGPIEGIITTLWKR